MTIKDSGLGEDPEFITHEYIDTLLEANQLLYGEDVGGNLTVIDICKSAIEVLDYSIKKQNFIEREMGRKFYCQADAEKAWSVRYIYPSYWLVRVRRLLERRNLANSK